MGTEFFTSEEIKAAKEMEFNKKETKTKSLKLNLDNMEDRLLYLYLEEKSFTDVIKKSLKIYKKFFDDEVLLRKELDNLEKSRALIHSVSPHRNEPEPQKQLQNVEESEALDLEEF